MELDGYGAMWWELHAWAGGDVIFFFDFLFC